MDTTNPNESNDPRPESGLTAPAPETLPDASSEVAQRLPPIGEAPPRATCPNCGAAIASGTKFCGRCGAATGQCCPRCGAKLEPGVEFCGECGASLTPPRPARFLESWRRGWRFRVSGRASRGEYWWRQLGMLIECAVLYVVLGLLVVDNRAFGRHDVEWCLGILCVYFVIMGIPLTCLCIRRLHDQGLSGWFVLLWNIRPLGLIFSLLPGTPGPNAYGPVPGSEKSAAERHSGNNVRQRIHFAGLEFGGRTKTAVCILSAILASIGIVFAFENFCGHYVSNMFLVFAIVLPFIGFPFLVFRKTTWVGWLLEGIASLLCVTAFFTTLRWWGWESPLQAFVFFFPLGVALPLFWLFFMVGARRCRNVCAWIMAAGGVLVCCLAAFQFLFQWVIYSYVPLDVLPPDMWNAGENGGVETFERLKYFVSPVLISLAWIFFAGSAALWTLIALLERGGKGGKSGNAVHASENGPGVTAGGGEEPKLIGVTDEIKGFEIPLAANGETSLGRGEDNAVVLEHPSVSGHHCLFVGREGQLTLRDLGSTNGTLVNSRPVTEEGVVLRHKDLVQIGTVEFMVEVPEPGKANPA